MTSAVKKQTSITVALALGSNLGDRLANLRAAVAALKDVMSVTLISPVYETAPAYVTDQPAFLNAALIAETTLTPRALLHHLKELEKRLGRTETFQNGPRMIDLDILFYGNQVVDEGAPLIIPHLRMAERRFVLQPLADIAPYWMHPQTGLSVSAMLALLPEDGALVLEDKLS